MKLLIHDLNEEEFAHISNDYKDFHIISDNGTIRPCIGCFGCWVKTPGKCVIKDGYDNIGDLIHEAYEVVVISRYTYGGFSSFVKNVFDRCIGYVSPFFEIYKDEMHHKKRYPEDKPVTCIFRSDSFTPDQKEAAKRYVKSMCTNLHGLIKDISFEECKSYDIDKKTLNKADNDKEGILFINCSLRADNANSKRFLNYIDAKIKGDKTSVNLLSYMNKQDELIKLIADSSKIVLSMPLYVDGIPSAPLRLMEKLEEYSFSENKKIYLIANMGLFESKQLVNLMNMVKEWSNKCGFEYCGGVAIGAGEMQGMMTDPSNPGKGPAKNVIIGLNRLSEAVEKSTQIEDIYADSNKFSRSLYMFIANTSWPRGARKNGLKKKDL
ncbi:MAG: flavodoxin family protein [Lachnospiraceae bacterium]|nr:flavodoxin family protein [Lachnospiraceae bacterium]